MVSRGRAALVSATADDDDPNGGAAAKAGGDSCCADGKKSEEKDGGYGDSLAERSAASRLAGAVAVYGGRALSGSDSAAMGDKGVTTEGPSVGVRDDNVSMSAGAVCGRGGRARAAAGNESRARAI